MASRKTDFQEDTRFRLLRLLEENPEMSQRNLAKALGVSLGSVHYLLRALIDMGLIKLENFTAAKDKRRYAYVLTARGIREKAAITKRFLSRKLAEYEALKREIRELKNSASEDPTVARSFSKPNVANSKKSHS